MARQVSNQPIVGRIGNLVYYKRNGKYFVRTMGFPSRERIKKAPEFEKTRNLNSEFAGCATAGKGFREALAPLLEHHADAVLSPRIIALLSKVVKHGQGAFGARMIQVRKNKECMTDFQFRKRQPFDKIFLAETAFTCNASRKRVTMTIPSIVPSVSFGKLKGVSHYRLFVSLVAFPEYKPDKVSEKYRPVSRFACTGGEAAYSEVYSLKQKVKDLSLVAALSLKRNVPETAGVVVIAGIEFFKEENGKMYLDAGKSCMKIAKVF